MERNAWWLAGRFSCDGLQRAEAPSASPVISRRDAVARPKLLSRCSQLEPEIGAADGPCSSASVRQLSFPQYDTQNPYTAH